MTEQLQTFTGELAEALIGAFLFPANVLLSILARWLPETADALTSGNGAVVTPVVLALVGWVLFAALTLLFLKLCRNVLHQLRAIVLTLWHRLRTAFAGFIMRITWKYRALFTRRDDQAGAVLGPTVELDDLDLAILRALSAMGPGFAISAPDLAEKFRIRPAQAQRSFDKLSGNHLISSVIGTTDGFENYRLTDYGLAFAATLERRRHAEPAQIGG